MPYLITMLALILGPTFSSAECTTPLQAKEFHRVLIEMSRTGLAAQPFDGIELELVTYLRQWKKSLSEKTMIRMDQLKSVYSKGGSSLFRPEAGTRVLIIRHRRKLELAVLVQVDFERMELRYMDHSVGHRAIRLSAFSHHPDRGTPSIKIRGFEDILGRNEEDGQLVGVVTFPDVLAPIN